DVVTAASVSVAAGRPRGLHSCRRARPAAEPLPDHGGPVAQTRPVAGGLAPDEGGRFVGGGQAQSDRDALTADAGPAAILPVDVEARSRRLLVDGPPARCPVGGGCLVGERLLLRR